jgi:disulfide bond formation protein DsbB
MRQIIQLLHNSKCLALAVVTASVAILAAAYISQYGFGLKPCILCLYQRVPYFANIAVGLAAFLTSFYAPRLTKPLLFLAAMVFFADTFIAGFHVGVEYGWWKGLPSCGGDILPENVSIEALRASITQQAIIRCDKPAWVLFGISMAGYNVLLSSGLGIGVLYFLRGLKK